MRSSDMDHHMTDLTVEKLVEGMARAGIEAVASEYAGAIIRDRDHAPDEWIISGVPALPVFRTALTALCDMLGVTVEQLVEVRAHWAMQNANLTFQLTEMGERLGSAEAALLAIRRWDYGTRGRKGRDGLIDTHFTLYPAPEKGD